MISLSVLWGYVQLLQTTAESIAEHRAACLVYRTTPALTEAGQRWGVLLPRRMTLRSPSGRDLKKSYRLAVWLT